MVKLTGTAPSAAAMPLSYHAQPSLTKMITDGESTRVNAYNIGSNNFYKIRDLQNVCANTDYAFTVEWNKEKMAIELTTAAPKSRDSVSTEALSPQNAVPSSAVIYKDGKQLKLTAIDGYTYFKLRDIGDLFGFKPIWNESDSSITLKFVEEE